MSLHISKIKGRKTWETDFFAKESFDLHSHSFFEVMVSLADGGRHHLNDRDLPVRKGDIFLLGPYHIHRAGFGPGGGVKHFNLGFSAAALMGGGSPRAETWQVLHPFLNPQFPLPLRVPGPVFEDLLSLMGFLHRECTSDAPFHEPIGLGILLAFLHLLARHYPGNPVAQDAAVLATLNRIAEGYRDDLTTQDLAEKERLSPARLAQRFRKATGNTIKDTLTSRRLLEARRLLEGTHLSITEIMAESGFNDLSYFNKAFKASAGVAPSAYREKARKHR